MTEKELTLDFDFIFANLKFGSARRQLNAHFSEIFGSFLQQNVCASAANLLSPLMIRLLPRRMEKANPVSAGSVDCGLNSLWEAQNTIFGGDGCRRKIQKPSLQLNKFTGNSSPSATGQEIGFWRHFSRFQRRVFLRLLLIY